MLRERHIKSLLSTVDAFVSPSAFLKQRYVEWGLADDRIQVIPNGQPERPRSTAVSHERAKSTFGYFGNLNPWKGATVLLEAAKLLIAEGFDFELRVHGAAPFQSESFVSEIDELLPRHLLLCSGVVLTAARISRNSSNPWIAPSCLRSGGKTLHSSFRKHRTEPSRHLQQYWWNGRDDH